MAKIQLSPVAITIKRIEELIAERGLTYTGFASMLGKSEAMIRNWKKGSSSPTYDQVYRSALILDVSTDYLFGLTDDKTPRPKRESGMDENQEKLIRAVRLLTPDNSAKLLELASLFLAQQGKK